MICVGCQHEHDGTDLCGDCRLDLAVADLASAWRQVQRLVQSKPWWERRELADNPQLPAPLLYILAEDKDAHVAGTARYWLSQRVEADNV